jgi:ABC-2 type transport system permease protein
MIAYRTPLSPHILLLPVLIFMQTFLMLSLSLILSSLYVFYRDVGSILEITLMGWFYATPIIYPFWLAAAEIPKRFSIWASYIYLLNPITPLVVAYRRVLFHALLPTPEMSDVFLIYYLLYVLALSVIMYNIFVRIFSRLAVRFADEL